MQITVKGKQMDVGDSLREHAEQSLDSLVNKYFAHGIDAQVVFSKEKSHLFRADITAHPIAGLVVQGTAVSEAAPAAFDAAAERIAKQLRRYKRRLTDHKGGRHDAFPAQARVLAPETETDDELPAEEAQPVVVAETAHHIPLCSVSGAVMRLDLADSPALMFRNRADGRLNMVYRRADGNIGWVEPQEGEEGSAA